MGSGTGTSAANHDVVALTTDESTGIITINGIVGAGPYDFTLTDTKITAGARVYVTVNSGVTVGAALTTSAQAAGGGGSATITIMNGTGANAQGAGLVISFLVVN